MSDETGMQAATCEAESSSAPRDGVALHPVVAQAVAFTEMHRRHRGDPPALREAHCLRTQYPALMAPLGPEDVFAGGRAEGRICYVGSMWWAMMPDGRGPSKQGGYCCDFDAAREWGRTEADRAAIAGVLDYWRAECTVTKVAAEIDPAARTYLRRDGQITAPGACGFCVALDLNRLVTLGVPGLEARVVDARREALARGGDPAFFDGLLIALDVLLDVCGHYGRQAREQAAAATSPADRARLERIAGSLAAIAARPPASFHEATQLLWLYTVLAGGLHLEVARLDDALGPFLAADLDAGRLTEEQALELVLGLWRLWARNGTQAVCRVTIGGRGRRDPAAADRFARLAIAAARRHRGVIPQLTLRFHEGQDPSLMRAAFDALGDGCVFPVLYNDDVNIPGVAAALHVDAREAESYFPLGCGEYMLAGSSPSLLNFGWSVPRTLEAALRGGRDAAGEPLGPDGPALPDMGGMDELIANVRRQAGFAAELAARGHVAAGRVLGRECAFLFASLLTDDCLARGRSMMDGGARHPGACLMGHGFTNAADGLTAIRRLVFEQRRIAPADLLAALASDFEGAEPMRRQLADQPKFGNDDPDADRELVELWRLLSKAADEAGRRAGLPFLTVSSVNPGGYHMGHQCGATADGRRAGRPFAIGHAPTAGHDRSGLTALLNSLAKVDPANGGAASNIKLAKDLFRAQRAQLETLFRVFWGLGGLQAMVSVVNQADLVDALDHPERHPHLLVRLGGWTVRFVELERAQQEEIIRRSIY